jgi:hypothetical protein
MSYILKVLLRILNVYFDIKDEDALLRIIRGTYHHLANSMMRISLRDTEPASDLDNENIVQGFLMIVRIPFREEIIIDLGLGDPHWGWERFSLSQLKRILEKLAGYYHYTSAADTLPILKDVFEALKKEIQEREQGAQGTAYGSKIKIIKQKRP